MRRDGIAVEEPAHVLVDHRMAREQLRKLLQLDARGQVPVDEEVCRLHEAAVLAQLFDRDAAVAQDSFLAVQERD